MYFACRSDASQVKGFTVGSCMKEYAIIRISECTQPYYWEKRSKKCGLEHKTLLCSTPDWEELCGRTAKLNCALHAFRKEIINFRNLGEQPIVFSTAKKPLLLTILNAVARSIKVVASVICNLPGVRKGLRWIFLPWSHIVTPGKLSLLEPAVSIGERRPFQPRSGGIVLCNWYNHFHRRALFLYVVILLTLRMSWEIRPAQRIAQRLSVGPMYW